VPAPSTSSACSDKQCGHCSIQDLQEEGRKVGYAVLVAEGSALVMALIQTGRSMRCRRQLPVSFSSVRFVYEARPSPGLRFRCCRTTVRTTGVDIEWVWDVLHMTGDDKTRRLDLDALRGEVHSVRAGSAGPSAGTRRGWRHDEIAREWMARAGKRWRPFLTVCVWEGAAGGCEAAIPESLKKLRSQSSVFTKPR